jgi:hypothetical protein
MSQVQIAAANTHQDMLRQDFASHQTETAAEVRRHELAVDATLTSMRAYHTNLSQAETAGRHELDTVREDTSSAGSLSEHFHPGDIDRDLIRPGICPMPHHPVQEPLLAHQQYLIPRGAVATTGVIIGEQVHFTHSLKEFTAEAVFRLLGQEEKYELQYPTQVALVRHVGSTILDAITINPQHGDDLPPQARSWTPFQSKTAMT